MISEQTEKVIKKELEWGVGKGKRWATLDELIIECKEIFEITRGYGGYFGVLLTELIPYLEKKRDLLREER